MAGIQSIFNIGRLALFSSQTGISVAAHNIANVNTEGYSRQEPIFNTAQAVSTSAGQLGMGVEVTEVRRLVSSFIENQITEEKANGSRLEIEQTVLGRVEESFSDSDGTGINQSLTEFFIAWQDLANTPQAQSNRVVLLENARSLAQRLVTANAELEKNRKDLDREIKDTISTINTLAVQIADLNKQISGIELRGENANDLRDERRRAVNNLTELAVVTTFEDSVGQLAIIIGGGQPLVSGDTTYAIRASSNPDNEDYFDVVFDPGSGTTINITNNISNGRLKGLIDLRDTVLPGYIDQMDQLAAGLINEVNQQHRVGFGLDSSTGNDFFSPLSITTRGLSTNTAGVFIDNTSITDPTALTLDSYELTFSGGNYTIRNLESNTTAATGAYADPTTVVFDGISIRINGPAVVGDTFSISSHKGFAKNIAVAITDPNEIAASSTLNGVPGNNANAILLAQVQEKTSAALNNASIPQFYAGLSGEVGARSRLAQSSGKAQAVIMQQLTKLREQTSGVSLDEEIANLIRYQRSYAVAARVIQVADQLFETLLEIR